MDRPPVQSPPVRIRRERRWIAFSLLAFLVLWLIAAVLIRARPFGLAQGILFAAPFLFVFGLFLGPILLNVFRTFRKTHRASGTR
jgi:hypothetical protein